MGAERNQKRGELSPERREGREAALAGAAFTLFVMIACHRLSHSSLWFDETIEYWYSKVMFGTLPFSATTNMYQRIMSTLQPPLYNVLLYFWLLVSDTQWWFRFFGVACGLGGMIALYRSIRYGAGSGVLAAAAVAVSSCVYQLVFYWQEASEYCLMLGLLFWTGWFWLRLTERPDRKTILLFTVFSILPVYSQYGAVFPVAAMAAGALVVLLVRRERRAAAELLAAYGCAGLFAALPLYVFFLRRQITFQHGGGALRDVSFAGGPLRDCLSALHAVFRWNLIPDYNQFVSWFLLLAALLSAAALLVRGSGRLRALTGVNLAAWFLYYGAVKAGLYADMTYGGFGNRYNLFFLPLWLLWGFLALPELCAMGGRALKKLPEGWGIWRSPALLRGAAACFLAAASLLSWTERIQPNWEKDHIQQVVSRWYQEPADSTLVYYASAAGFAYYLRMNPGYTGDEERGVTYMPWLNDRTGEEYQAWLDETYGETWPETLDIAASHYGEDLAVLSGQFEEAGYARQVLYDSGDCLLLRLTRGDG